MCGLEEKNVKNQKLYILHKNRIKKYTYIKHLKNKMSFVSSKLHTQNDLLMRNLMDFYQNHGNLDKMMRIINGESKISLRIVDWFVTNYAKKYYTVYDLSIDNKPEIARFKVYNDYKLKLKAYSKKRFDPFCRWERITIPYDNEKFMETTIGQLNFFKWAIENKIVDYIETNYVSIEDDMNFRNSTSKRKHTPTTASSTDSETSISSSSVSSNENAKTRKKREELSESACKCIKKESIKIIVKFN
jgi:hypothetical protein